MADIRILVVAEDPLARAGISALLGGKEGLLVAAQVGFTPDLAEDAHLHAADLILVDAGWEAPQLVIHLNQALAPGLPVLALVPDVISAEQAWALGLPGVLLRQFNAAQLETALQAIATGLRVTLPDLVLHTRLPEEAGSQVEALTPREREVLQCLAEGASNKEIALRLAISEHTVKFHINSLLGKLGVQSRTEAVVRATRLGLVLL